MTRLGYQIPSFDYPDGDGKVSPAGIFDLVVQQAKEADTSGFDTVMVMDHFYQLPMLGEPDDYMLECYTLLAALAQHTTNAKLSALVTGNTYRNPAVLAKIITSLDIVSGGRAQLGIGAGWFELEHDSFGIEFGTFTDRFEKLEEALQIILPMLRDERPSLDGERYTAKDVINQPAPISKIPVMIGGSGEKKTLRMVAQYADDSNMTAGPEEIPRKLDALAGHCERLGRDRSEITVTMQRNACIAPTHDEAVADMNAFFKRRGMDLDAMPAEQADSFRSLITHGSPDEIGEQFSEWMTLGIDGFTVNSIVNGHVPGRVALLGETLSKVVG